MSIKQLAIGNDLEINTYQAGMETSNDATAEGSLSFVFQ
jgi:hypothetical protein